MTSSLAVEKSTHSYGPAASNGVASGPGGATARLAAIAAVTSYRPITPPLNFAETSTQELFAPNVFSKAVMKDRLPKPVYKSLLKTIESGEKLDPSIADVVASAMKDWAIEKGATHYAHVFYPLTGATAEKHDSFLSPERRRRRDRGVQRQPADPGRAGRIELPDRRHPADLRGARLHRLGRDQPGLHPREPERHDAVHPDGLRLLDRRGARQEDAAAALDAGAQRSRRSGS